MLFIHLQVQSNVRNSKFHNTLYKTRVPKATVIYTSYQ